MTKIILSGSGGKMGRTVIRTVDARTDCQIVAGISKNAVEGDHFPTFISPGKVDVDVDVIIDFSHPDLLEPLLNFATYKKIPIVICTTGFNNAQVSRIKEAAKRIPIFFSGNMSLGINLLIELAKKATTVLGIDFDIEIIERHHNQKIDAPSGTAMMIADSIKSTGIQNYEYTYARQPYRQARCHNEIGIHSVRGGTIVGEHEVSFAGKDEVLTISHSAQSKEIFAIGAVNAALFLISQTAGLYCMADLLGYTVGIS